MLINANTQSLFSAEALKSVDKTMSSAMERLSSGKQVNSAGDNPAGLAMSTLLSADIQAIGQSVRNVNDAISLIQTAEGATQEITNILQRMRELAVQAVNDTNSEADRSYLNLEFQQLKQEIVRITEMTEWNGFKVLDGSAGAQIGEIPVYKVVSHGLSGESLLSHERTQVIEGETAGETQQWAFSGQPQSGVLRIGDAEITLTEAEANADLSTFVENIATKLRQTDSFNASSGRVITASGSSLLVTYPVTDGQQDLAELTPSSDDFSMVATVRSEAMISAEEFFSNQMTFRSSGLLTIEIDEASDTPSASFTLPDGEVIQLLGTLDRSAGLVTFVKSDGDNQRLFVSDADSDTLSYAFRDADNGTMSLSGRAVLLNVGVEGSIPGLRAGDLQINGIEVGRSFASDDLVSPRNNASGSGIAKAAAINRVSLETGVYARVNTTLMPGQAMFDTTAVTGAITINGVRTGDIESIAYDSAATRRQVIDAVNAISHRTGVKAAQLGDDETGITLLAEDGRNIEIAFITPFNKSVFGRGIGLREGVQASTIALESKIPQSVQLTSSFTGDISRVGFREGDFSSNETRYHTADRTVSLAPQVQIDSIQLGSEMALGDTFSVIVNGTQFTSDDSYELIQDARDDLITKINNNFTLGVTAKAGRTQDEILLEAQVAGVPFSASASDTSWTTVSPTYKLVDSNGDGISDYLEFSALGVDTETLTIPEDGMPSSTLDELSLVAGVLYRGNGVGAVGIGRVDAINNGELGKPLRINFENVINGASLVKFPVTGHYYEVVDTGGITWSDAQEMASNRTLYGLTGYLATVTSEEESNYLKTELNGKEGWIGASDEIVEGEWRWVSGPEAGQLFWLGNVDGSPVDSRFSNWTKDHTGNYVEPNDDNNEDYAYYRQDGTWNDYRSDNAISSYIVEYGGLNNEVEVLPLLSSLEADLLLSRLIYTNTAESQGNFSSLGRASSFSAQQNELPVQSTLGENDLVINGVKIRAATNSDDNASSIIPKSSSLAASAIATANAINSHLHQTGVRAEPIGPVSKGLMTDTSLVPSTTDTSVQTLYLNGVAVDVDFVRDEPEDSRREKVVRAINERFGTHGVNATNNGEGVTLTTDGRNLSVWFDSSISGLSAAHFGLAGAEAVAQVSVINFGNVPTEEEPSSQVFTVSINGVSIVSDSVGSAQEGAENLASKIREKISAGEITNIEIEPQGDDIIVRSTVAGTAFDIDGVSIDGEGQTTMSVGTRIPNELDAGIVTGIPNANELSDSARTAYGSVRLIASPASVEGVSGMKEPTLIHIEAGLNGYTREGDFIGLGFEEGIFGGRSSQEMDPPRIGRLTFQVGSRHEEQLTIDIPDIGPRGAVTGRITLDSRLSANDQTIRLESRESASEVLDYLDEAMFEVDRFRGHLGANSSRLSNIIDNLQTTTFNRESSRSQIMDADYARESTELIKSQLLQQASTATLAQANASQKFVLEMLRG
jgi:flagellin-like hook-associated protein FlgL